MAPVNRRILIQGGMGIAVSSWQLALFANVGLGQLRRDGSVEPPAVTLGQDLDGARALLRAFPDGWTAADSVAGLLSARAVPAAG